MQAAQMYVSEHETKEYQHMRTSQYFVRKQNVDKSWICDLADYCMAAESKEPDIIEKPGFSERIN